jgi:hypothetical protein
VSGFITPSITPPVYSGNHYGLYNQPHHLW